MRRARHIVATAVAVAALAVTGWNSFQPLAEAPSRVTEVTLWTTGAGPVAPRAGLHVALPDATHAPDGAARLADAASLRRAHPTLERVVIEGDGVDAADAGALSGLAVEWHRPAAVPGEAPRIVRVAAPRVMRVGERMTVHGRVRGVRAGPPLAVSLEGPDGTTRSAEISATPDGEATFVVTSGTAAVAPGAFEWKLRPGPGSEPLVIGAVVAKPELPRVLILAASPGVEAARLQSWLADVGAPVTVRTRVSADHVRFAAAHGSPGEFAAIDAATLAQFDLVIAREAALRELVAAERAALEDAIRAQGLGLLVIGETADGARGDFFLPWSFQPVGGGEPDGEHRLARLQLRDGTDLAEPITVLPAEITALPAARWLVRDSRGRTLGAAVVRGRGWMARSLVVDTWRWRQGGHPEIFAAYWSALLSALARPAAPADGRWQLENGSGPLRAGELVRLAWIGGPAAAVPRAEVHRGGERNATPVPLELARDAREPARAEALYWPMHPGWHYVRTVPAGASLAFYVQAADAWPGVRAELRRGATARLVENGSEPGGKSRARRDFEAPRAPARYVWFALFVMSAGWLWLEQRRL